MPNSFNHYWTGKGGNTSKGDVQYHLIIEADIPAQKKHFINQSILNVVRFPSVDIVERYEKYKRDYECIDKSLLKTNLVRTGDFRLKESVLRCLKSSGNLKCVYNFGKEIYSKKDFCNCVVNIDNSRST